jgi:hypothetical protein
MTIAIRTRVRIRDAVISVGAIGILIALLAITDDRVRERLTGVTTGAVSHQVARGTGQLTSVSASARELIVDSGPLTILVITGAVLFVFMLRT